MKSKLLVLLSAVGLLAFSNAGFSAMVEDKKADDEIEIIEVIGSFSAPQLQKIADQARFDFYETFNKYNENKEFKVICRPKAQIGTRIKENYCEPAYFKSKYLDMTQAMFLQATFRPERLPSYSDIAFAVKAKKKEADAYMVALAAEHPELQKSLERMVKARRVLDIRRSLN